MAETENVILEINHINTCRYKLQASELVKYAPNKIVAKATKTSFNLENRQPKDR